MSEGEVSNPTSLPPTDVKIVPRRSLPPLDFTFITGDGNKARELHELLSSLTVDTFLEDAVAPLGAEEDYITTPREESLKAFQHATERSKTVATKKDPLVLVVEVNDREEDRVKSAAAARREEWLAKHPPKTRVPLYDPTYISQQQAMTLARFPDSSAASPRSPTLGGGAAASPHSPLPSSSPHSRQSHSRSPNTLLHHHHTNSYSSSSSSPPMGLGYLPPPPPSSSPQQHRPNTRQQQYSPPPNYSGGGGSGVLDGAPPYWPTGNLPLDSSTPEVFRDPEVDRQEKLKIDAMRESLRDFSVESLERAYAPQRIPAEPGW